ncbi:MAG: hypothetical protein ACXVC7_16360 [Bacteroidia bacterium]
MGKRYPFYILYILFAVINLSFAQPAIDNDKAHRRYWFYRTRMINDFMKIGKNQGECIVLAERNQGLTDNTVKLDLTKLT